MALRTDGRTDLATWLAAKSHTQVWLAKTIGAAKSSVSRWLKGTERPSYAARLAIHRVTKIPPDAWLTGRERRGVDAAETAGVNS